MSKPKRPELWHCWQGMLRRCYYQKDKQYHNYGGRGITVCERWRKSYDAFVEDMGPRPSTKHSVDRYPNQDGNYESGNCRWATSKEQQNNRRNNRILTLMGRSQTMAQWAEELGISIYALSGRLSRGVMSVEEALTYRPPLIEYNGKALSATEWSALVNVSANTISKRISYGWTAEEALTTPIDKSKWNRKRQTENQTEQSPNNKYEANTPDTRRVESGGGTGPGGLQLEVGVD